jgi:hypothetical protein
LLLQNIDKFPKKFYKTTASHHILGGGSPPPLDANLSKILASSGGGNFHQVNAKRLVEAQSKDKEELMRSFDDARRKATRNLVRVQKDFQIKIDDIQKKQDALQKEKEELEAKITSLFDLFIHILPLTFRLWMCSAGQTLPSTSTSGRYASIN